MRTFTAVLIAGALALIAVPTQAFQERGGADASAPSAELQSGDLSRAPAPPGPAIVVPGLGQIGVIPKLDFGLELLYGQGPNGAPQPRVDEVPSEGLQIRGTVKHRF
ncbi:MAG: hypothetical protein ACFCUN_14125 [Hyphomicrobiaceae bacterium]